MDDKKAFSNALKTVKLLTSSLFARKQPYMIINGHTPGMFYYTNIDRDRITLYRPTMEDVLSKVTIKAADVTNVLNEAFPLLTNIVAEIDLMQFSTQLNKALKYNKNTAFPKLVIEKERENTISMVVDPDPSDKEDHIIAYAPIGRLLAEHDPEFYEDIIRNYEKFSDQVVNRKFRVNQVLGDDKVSLEIVEIEGKEANKKYEFALPVKDGVTMVSTKEYVNKRELDPLYNLVLRVNPMGRTSKATILYDDDWLDAMTIMPGSLWFMNDLLI